MVNKRIPDVGIGALLGKSFGLDFDAAESQVSLVLDAHNALEESGDALGFLAEGQTSSLWTGDGNSVPLAAELTAKYNAALKWRESIKADLNLAAVNLRQAIKDTTELNDNQQAWYLSRLETVLGPDPLDSSAEGEA